MLFKKKLWQLFKQQNSDNFNLVSKEHKTTLKNIHPTLHTGTSRHKTKFYPALAIRIIHTQNSGISVSARITDAKFSSPLRKPLDILGL